MAIGVIMIDEGVSLEIFSKKSNNGFNLQSIGYFGPWLLSLLLILATVLFPEQLKAQGFETITNLPPVPASKNTGEKPQSKVWTYAGKWWTVSPNSTGTWVWRLDGTSWTSVLRISPNTTTKADCKVVDDVCHILLWKEGTSQLVSLEYDPETSNYKLWTDKVDPITSITLDDGVEVATIDVDGTGRMWLASTGINDVIVRWSDPPYSSWSDPIIIATGIADDDISVVTSLPLQGQIGVLWSNQNTKRFGFKTHMDGSDPSTWSADEVPASQSAVNVGNGMADDHMNLALAADGTLYCAVKTSYDTPGYPNISLLKRHPSGTWDNLYGISESGTRAIVVLNESIGKLKVIYASLEGGGDILYRESSTSSISFGSPLTLKSGFYSNPTSTKDNYDSEIVILFSDATSPSITSFVGALAVDSPPPAVPSAPALTSPTDSEIDVSLSPMLTWGSSTNASSYQVQVSSVSNFSSLLIDESELATTSFPISGLSKNTIYYWRVRASNSIGSSNWSASRSFTTTAANTPIPSAPVLLSPSNAANDVDTNPTLSWNEATNATFYQVQVSTDSDFSSILFDESDVSTISFAITGLSNNEPYYWRVRAVNATGSSEWSAIWGFTTIPFPSEPTLASPSNEAIDVATKPTLSWVVAANASAYQVQVSVLSDFSSVVIDEIDIENTSLPVSGLINNTSYYWRVRSVNSSGVSAWSAAWSFTTIPLPSVPILLSPGNLSTGIATNPILSWEASTHANIYQIQISLVSDFSSLIDEVHTETTSFSVIGLTNNTVYYWRVRSVNSSGISEWSSAWSFSTIPLPSVPVRLSPVDNTIDIDTNPVLSWVASENADNYQVQVSAATDFSSTLIDEFRISTTSFQAIGLINNTIYYWRVRAKNISGASIWSDIGNFKTVMALPTTPVLLSPADLSTNIITNPILNWNTAENATSYQVQISRVSDFSNEVDEVYSETTSFSITGLTNNSGYYWRVRSVNSSGVSPWSTTWSFTTIPLPSVPTLIYPVDHATDIGTSPLMSWNSAEHANTYQVQLSMTIDFSSTIIDEVGISITSFRALSLNNKTVYYWRVRAKNISGNGPWSSARSFTTIDKALVGSWKMNEGSGTTLIDDSGFGNNASTQGNPIWVTDLSSGLALKLNGTDQYAIVTDAPSLAMSQAITLSAWIRPEKKASQFIVQKGNIVDGYELMLLNTGELLFQFNQVSANSYKLTSNTSYPTDGTTWMHIAATYNGQTSKIYINGIENNSFLFGLPTPININDMPLSIGAKGDGTNLFAGTIDDVRIYNYALTGAEISNLFLNTDHITGIVSDFEISSNNNLSGYDIRVYPNPVDDILTLEFGTELATDNSISIVDINGRKCFETSIANESNKAEIDLCGLNLISGLYFVMIRFNDFSELSVIKFIKK